MARKAGNNKHGNKNEIKLVEALNEKKYSELNLNLKKFVDYICENENMEINVETIIHSEYETDNNKKQDLYIELLDRKFGISVKMGSGNSTHQEKCEDFVDYIKEEFNASEQICDDFRVFIWCDGTLDGTGEVSARMTGKNYLLHYSDGIGRIRKFVDDHKRELIERALFVGRHDSKVDYIYHGTPENGQWISSDEIIEFQVNNSQKNGRALAKIGRMNLQVWNRSLAGTSDEKRGQLQIKYPSLEKDLKKIMHSNASRVGTFEGDQEEFNIAKILNKNKNSSMWSTLDLKGENDNIYAVKVMYHAYSQLVKKRVKTKTDAYLIAAELEPEFLLECEYALTEDTIKEIEYTVVKDSGISVKKSDSSKYTYEKLSKTAFDYLFSDYLDNVDMIFCGLTIYQEDKNIGLNRNIVENLGLQIEDVSCYFIEKIEKDSFNLFDKEDVKLIRNYCEQELRKVIDNNENIKKMIFTGEGCFNPPYYINYIYKNGVLSKDIIPEDYQISNGSGRSKGKYTIIFKPRGNK